MRRLAQRHLDAPLGGGGDGTSNLRVASLALLYVLSHTPPMDVSFARAVRGGSPLSRRFPFRGSFL